MADVKGQQTFSYLKGIRRTTDRLNSIETSQCICNYYHFFCFLYEIYKMCDLNLKWVFDVVLLPVARFACRLYLHANIQAISDANVSNYLSKQIILNNLSKILVLRNSIRENLIIKITVLIFIDYSYMGWSSFAIKWLYVSWQKVYNTAQ